MPLVVAGGLMAVGIWLHLTERHEHEHTHEAVSHDHWHHHDEHHQHGHAEPVAAGTDGYAEKQTKSGRIRRVPLLGNAPAIAARYGKGRKRSERLFTTPTGAQLNNGNFKRALDWAATAHGHREYDLRHTAATSWLEDNVDIKTVAAWLGHATTQLTLDTYGHHMGSDADAAAIERIRRMRESGA